MLQPDSHLFSLTDIDTLVLPSLQLLILTLQSLDLMTMSLLSVTTITLCVLGQLASHEVGCGLHLTTDVYLEVSLAEACGDALHGSQDLLLWHRHW